MEEPPEDTHFAYLHHLENSQWEKNYVAGIQMMIHCYNNYTLSVFPPHP